MTSNAEALSDTQTLAHLLEFLTQLENKTEVKKKVITDIKEKVKGYVKDDQKFSVSSGYLYKTIEKSKELRTNIVKKGKDREYQYYKQSFDKDGINETDYAKLLINNIFPLFGCLYYMYYECSGECSYIEGGEWSVEQCDGTGGDLKKYLNKWLKDETGKVKPPDNNGFLMIDRGFKQDNLSDRDGKTLFPRGSFNSLLYFNDGAQLQFALYYMLFLPEDGKWDNAQSGHAVLFLQALCKMVSEEQFKDMYVEKDGEGLFKTACQTVERKISTLLKSEFIVPVSYEQKGIKYSELLERKHFWKYIGWLIKNLSRLMTSLKDMESDCQHWNQESLKKSNSFGPYPWGFVFKQNWTSGGGSEKKLKDPLSELNTALTKLENVAREIKPIPSSNGSSIGSVIGGLGAAAATGAAAYSGVLGTAAEAVGRFFKGLFI